METLVSLRPLTWKGELDMLTTAHRGCVSGFTVQNMHDNIKKGDELDWDMLDGYDELECVSSPGVTRAHIDSR